MVSRSFGRPPEPKKRLFLICRRFVCFAGNSERGKRKKGPILQSPNIKEF